MNNYHKRVFKDNRSYIIIIIVITIIIVIIVIIMEVECCYYPECNYRFTVIDYMV